ncbi:MULTISPECIES: MFS transporter [Streptomyces]|uniref:Probable actinorhodin transporter n=1 Tax=Streptomyces coelicolor (strain ATCC BAA-471 / A3(2) / M145) TaxID=100226 RepID=ACT22_STRCO|nr:MULTISPECIES: MFS transporter [Streptomyces]P46105.1 RecName: Full=Probable actinorhodin transporter [Streptomyces coelicolor A3(2)]AAA26690.1 ORF2 [Streptomyces coelicolor]MDX2928912.1 MFS transporter [Streptomyces sp. NRRL_B-16638]MDX3407644.1 MFS transporter [Streptomyces sp. ME02-6977A]MYU44605.1 MFS transporter [Streptomyces sp. SID7813]QFI44982.1 MFS transporter [Streptomyces coelicolor A3(2)]
MSSVEADEPDRATAPPSALLPEDGPGPDGTAAGPPPYARRWAALGVILGAEIMDLLDGTVMNVAAPAVRADLGGSLSVIQWITVGYTLAFAVLLVVGGRLGDIYGRKRMFVVGAVGFTAASVLCSVAAGPEMLTAARFLQGGLGALMIPQGLGLIKQMFPPKETAAAFGAFGPAIGLGAVLGPIVAGFLVDADLFGTGWRSVFLINLPIGVAVIVGAVLLLPEGKAPVRPKFDVVGMALVTSGLTLLIFPLVQGRERGWPAWAFVLMLAGAAVLVGFVAHELRQERRGGATLIELSLLRRSRYAAGLAVALVFFTGVSGMSLLLALHLQIGLGFSPTRAALTMTPWSVFLVVGAILTGAVLGSKFGRKALHGGLVVLALGVLIMLLTIGDQAGGLTSWELVPGIAVAGLGMGIMIGLLFDIALADVDKQEAGTASGVLTAVQQLGFTVGVAVLGTLFFGLLGSQATASVDDGASRARTELAAAGASTTEQDRLLADLRVCLRESASQQDSERTPDSCRNLQQARPAVAEATARAWRTAHTENFSTAMVRTLWVVIALLAVSFALAFRLPPKPREEEGF